MINPNYVDGLELKIKELAAERDAGLAQNAELVAMVDTLQDALMQCTELVSEHFYDGALRSAQKIIAATTQKKADGGKS